MLSEIAKRRMKLVGMFIAPIAMVKGASLMLGGGGPEDAEASLVLVAVEHEKEGAAKPLAWTDAQMRAAEYLTRLHDREMPASPLYYSESRGAEPTEISSGDDVAPIQFHVNAIIASIHGRAAAINNSLYRVGEIIDGTDWMLEFINSDQRSVVLRNVKTGETQTASVPIPKIDAPKPLEMDVKQPFSENVPPQGQPVFPFGLQYEAEPSDSMAGTP